MAHRLRFRLPFHSIVIDDWLRRFRAAITVTSHSANLKRTTSELGTNDKILFVFYFTRIQQIQYENVTQSIKISNLILARYPVGTHNSITAVEICNVLLIRFESYFYIQQEINYKKDGTSVAFFGNNISFKVKWYENSEQNDAKHDYVWTPDNNLI